MEEKANIWRIDGDGITYRKKNKAVCFSGFESVYHDKTTAEIYRAQVAEAVGLFLAGENVTVMAYGQTGTGKTYTMSGEHEDGLIYLGLGDILPGEITMSYMEIYNERVYDLRTRKALGLFTKDRTTQVAGLYAHPVKTEEEARAFLEICAANRSTNATEYNLQSSRSHTVLQIRRAEAVLNFIDLAGCEKIGAVEARRKEGSYINKSLLALSKIVSSLGGRKRAAYRDSKLTRILEQSLVPPSNIVAFCTVSSAAQALEETISTLNFAARLTKMDLRGVETAIPESPKELEISPLLPAQKGPFVGYEQDLRRAIPEIALECVQRAKYADQQAGRCATANNDYYDELFGAPPRHKGADLDALGWPRPGFSKLRALVEMYEKRILSLEAMISELLEKAPNKLMGGIFVLEKQMFNLRKQMFWCETLGEDWDD